MNPQELYPYAEELWFACAMDPRERDYLLGNAHTFLGRMDAFCARKEGSPVYRVSAVEVLANCSEAARWWVRGFLAGAEPEPPRDADGDYLEYGHPLEAAWRDKRDAWLVRGEWPEDESQHTP